MWRIHSLSEMEELISTLYELVCPMMAAEECVKCVVTDGSSMFTSDVEHLLSSLDIEHPAAELVIQTLKAHKNEHRTGTKTLLFMLTRLAKAIIQLHYLGISYHKSITVVQTAITQLIQEIEKISQPVTGSTFSHVENFSNSCTSHQRETTPLKEDAYLENYCQRESGTTNKHKCEGEARMRKSQKDKDSTRYISHSNTDPQISSTTGQNSIEQTAAWKIHRTKYQKVVVSEHDKKAGHEKKISDMSCNRIPDAGVHFDYTVSSDIKAGGSPSTEVTFSSGWPCETTEDHCPVDPVPACNDDEIGHCMTGTENKDSNVRLDVSNSITVTSEADPVFLKMIDTGNLDSGQEDIDWFFDVPSSSAHCSALSLSDNCTPDNSSAGHGSSKDVTDLDYGTMSSDAENCLISEQSLAKEDAAYQSICNNSNSIQYVQEPLQTEIRVSSSKENDEHDSDFEDCFDDVDNRKHFTVVVEPIPSTDLITYTSSGVKTTEEFTDRTMASLPISARDILLHNAKKHYFADIDFDAISNPSFLQSPNSIQEDEFDGCFSEDIKSCQSNSYTTFEQVINFTNSDSSSKYQGKSKAAFNKMAAHSNKTLPLQYQTVRELPEMGIKDTVTDKESSKRGVGLDKESSKTGAGLDKESSRTGTGQMQIPALTQALKSLGANKPIVNISASSRHFHQLENSSPQNTLAMESEKDITVLNPSSLEVSLITDSKKDIKQHVDNNRHKSVFENSVSVITNSAPQTLEISQDRIYSGTEEMAVGAFDRKHLSEEAHHVAAADVLTRSSSQPVTSIENGKTYTVDSLAGQENFHDAKHGDKIKQLNQLLSQKKLQFKSAMSQKVMVNSRHLASERLTPPSHNLSAEPSHSGIHVAESSHSGNHIAESGHSGNDIAESSHSGNHIAESSHSGNHIAESAHSGNDIAESSHSGIHIAESTHSGNHIAESSHSGFHTTGSAFSGRDISESSIWRCHITESAHSGNFSDESAHLGNYTSAQTSAEDMSPCVTVTQSHNVKISVPSDVPKVTQSNSDCDSSVTGESQCECQHSEDVRQRWLQPAKLSTPHSQHNSASWGCHGNVGEVAKQVFQDQIKGNFHQSFNLHLVDCLSLPMTSSSPTAAAATAATGSAFSVPGLVVSCDVNLLEMLVKRPVNPCSQRTLLINADLSPTYHHKGYKPTLGKQNLVKKNLDNSRESKAHLWSAKVLRVIQRLNVQALLVRGQVSSVLSEMCGQVGVLVIPNVRYHSLCVLSHLLHTDIITYVDQANEASICRLCLRPFSMDWIDQLSMSSSKRMSDSSKNSLLHICASGVQTVILPSTCEMSASLGEERFWKCLHRYVNAQRDGQVLPARASTELWCASHIRQEAQQALISGSTVQSVVLEMLAEVFMDFHHRVQLNIQHLRSKAVSAVEDGLGSSMMSAEVSDTTYSVLGPPRSSQKPSVSVAGSHHQLDPGGDVRCPRPAGDNASQDPVLSLSFSYDVWDNYQSKICAWQTAVDVVSVLLNLGSHITTGVDANLVIL